MASRHSNLAVRTEPSPESGPVSVELLDLSLIEGVDPERWLDLLQDQTEQLPPADSGEFHAAVHRLLLSSPISQELHEVLQYIADLGDASGQEAILEALAAEQVALPPEAHSDTPPSLVVRLWCLGARASLWLLILKLAWLGVTARTRLKKPQRECTGAGGTPRALTPDLEGSVAEHLAPVLRAKGLILQDVRLREHDSRITMVVLFGGREQMHVLAEDKRRERRRQRWACCDVVCYERYGDRLSIVTRHRGLIPDYRQVFGGALFGDDHYFKDEPLWSLESLWDADEARLDEVREEFCLQTLRVRRLVWQPDDGTRVTIEGQGVLERLRRLSPGREGSLREAELELLRTGFQVNRVQARFRVPDGFTCPPVHRAFVQRVAIALGFSHSSERRPTIWSIADGVFSAAPFEQVFQQSIEASERARLVTRASREFFVNGSEPSSGVLQLREELGARPYALPDSDHAVAAVRQLPDETNGWRLRRETLVACFSRTLGLRGAPAEVEAPWLWDAGSCETGEHRVRVLLVLQHPPRELDDRVSAWQQRSGETRLVLVHPRANRLRTSHRSVDCDDVLSPDGGVLVRILQAAGVSDISPQLLARGEPLTIAVKSRRVFVFGNEISLPERQLELLVVLAQFKRQGKRPQSKEVALLLGNKGVTGGEAIRVLNQSLRESLDRAIKESGRLVPGQSFFERDTKGYFLAVQPRLLDEA